MGVNRTDYIVYGWKLPIELVNRNGVELDFWEDENFLPYVEGSTDSKYRIIVDGMCGDYNVFGLILKEGGDEHVGWDFEDLNIDNLSEKDTILAYKDILNSDPKDKPRLFIFSHYS